MEDWFNFVLCQGACVSRAAGARAGIEPDRQGTPRATGRGPRRSRMPDETYTVIPDNADACAERFGLDLAPVNDCVAANGEALHRQSIALTNARSITYGPTSSVARLGRLQAHVRQRGRGVAGRRTRTRAQQVVHGQHRRRVRVHPRRRRVVQLHHWHRHRHRGRFRAAHLHVVHRPGRPGGLPPGLRPFRRSRAPFVRRVGIAPSTPVGLAGGQGAEGGALYASVYLVRAKNNVAATRS